MSNVLLSTRSQKTPLSLVVSTFSPEDVIVLIMLTIHLCHTSEFHSGLESEYCVVEKAITEDSLIIPPGIRFASQPLVRHKRLLRNVECCWEVRKKMGLELRNNDHSRQS